MLNFRVSPFHRRGTTAYLDTEPFEALPLNNLSRRTSPTKQNGFDKLPAFAKHLIALNLANATLKWIGLFLELNIQRRHEPYPGLGPS